MVFSNLVFLSIFMPVFFGVYYLLRTRTQRNIALLVASLVFYAWGEPVYIILILCSIIFNYNMARAVEKYQSKLLLIIDVVVNLLVIGVFKYADFFGSIFAGIFGLKFTTFGIGLPIGISFFTFQIISYVIDVYHKKVAAQKNILFLGAYITGFTHLVAGPIVRYETIAYELEHRVENMTDFSNGLRRFCAGLAKKVLIANNMGALCDSLVAQYYAAGAAGTPSGAGALGAWLIVISYTLQIYFDFSAYSDMAIGMGRMMGFHYLENFDYPYISRSITEFWRRWHMSLSSWFRDYVYIPLGGNRVKTPRYIFNILVVWALTGLWHGASWNFVLWGAYYGILLLLEKFFLGKALEKIPALGHIYTLLIVMCGWVIFRASSLPMAGQLFKSMVGGYGAGSLRTLVNSNILTIPALVFMAAGIVLSMPLSRLLKKKLENVKFGKLAIDAGAVAGVVVSYCFLLNGSYNPFIYFRF